MRNRWTIPLLLIVIGWNAGFFFAYAAQSTRAFLPTIANGQVQTRLVTLVDTDAGFVSVALIPNTTRVIVAYTDRRIGNGLFIGEHIGDTIRPIPDPLLNAFASKLLSTDPAFRFPGPKQGFGMPLIVGNEMRVYATARDEDDPTGPFKVKVLISAIPAPQ